MDKSVWSDSFWKTFHYIALGYPENPSPQDKLNYKTFYENFGKVLPCKECSIHYKNNFETNDIDSYLENSDKLFEWTVIFHNHVNKFTNSKILSIDDAKLMYPKNKINKNTSNKIFFILFVLLILFGVIIFQKNIRLKFKNLIKL